MIGPKPVWLINYEGVDVSDELAPMILSAEYVDHIEDKSDELRITLEDRFGRWREGWWPSKNDRITCQMGLEGQTLLDAGDFQVVDCEAAGQPDTITISALAAPQTGDLTTRQHRAFEGLLLSELVDRYASELELTVVGDIPQITIGRVTQMGETTLAFLRRLARTYGCAFSIRGTQLVFYQIAKLEAADTVIDVTRAGLGFGWSLKGDPQETYAACEVTWLDPDTKESKIARVLAPHARERVVVDVSEGEGLQLPTHLLAYGAGRDALAYLFDEVKAWQTFLVAKGLEVGRNGVDGLFFQVTRTSTKVYQARAGVVEVKDDAGVTIDGNGVVGPETLRAAVADGFLQIGISTTTHTEVAGRVLRIDDDLVETLEQAQARARSELQAANRLRVKGKLPMKVGNALAVAGATVRVAPDFGRFNGRYLVQTSRHNVARGAGYKCEVEVTYV